MKIVCIININIKNEILNEGYKGRKLKKKIGYAKLYVDFVK